MRNYPFYKLYMTLFGDGGAKTMSATYFDLNFIGFLLN